MAATSSASSPAPPRVASVDAYRGFVMFLMMAEVLHLCRVAANLRKDGAPSAFWDFLCHHQSHVAWVGCSLHDLIQPSFSFLVGVALPFSLAARAAQRQPAGRQWAHALGRALALVLLGVFLRSTGSSQTNWTLEDTLSQIGLGYPLLFALGFARPRGQWLALGVILAGYWLVFALHPLPPPGFDYSAVGVDAAWLEKNGLTGFAAHWQMNSNFAWAADRTILNWFPRPKPWEYNGGGYVTLSFIPTLGTMILGLIAGRVLKGDREPRAKLRWFLVAGVAMLAAGWALGAAGVCPVVKKVWTPSWVLFSGGWCFLLLAGFYAVADLAEQRRLFFPLMVIGANSIFAYSVAHLWDGFIAKNLKTHLGQEVFRFAGAAYEPFVQGAAVLLVFWLILWWMYRRKVFIRI